MRVLGALLLAASVLGGRACGARDRARAPEPTDHDAAVQRAALLTLFATREHAQRMVFWSDPVHESPTLGLLRAAGVPQVAAAPDTAALALPMPVHLETLASRLSGLSLLPEPGHILVMLAFRPSKARPCAQARSVSRSFRDRSRPAARALRRRFGGGRPPPSN